MTVQVLSDVPRRDVEFRTDDGTVLRGWFWPAQGRNGQPAPAIVMAHGVSGVRDLWMQRYGSAFAKAGFNALYYDPRGFGASDGRVRQEIVPAQLVDDVRDAISFLVTLPEVDPDKVGLWGSSYGGGVMTQTASLDSRVRCVAVQVPFVSGSAVRAHVPAAEWQGLSQWFTADRQARAAGAPPQTLKVIAPDKSQPCILGTAEAWTWGNETARHSPGWKNEVTVRSLELTFTFDPIHLMDRITAPYLCIAATRDDLIPYDLVRAAFERAGGPKELLTLEMGHFDPYDRHFSETSGAAVSWFQRHFG